MATTYNRQINLYINGKQVSNDLRSIRAEMARLVNEQARMTIGSDEYIRQLLYLTKYHCNTLLKTF